MDIDFFYNKTIAQNIDIKYKQKHKYKLKLKGLTNAIETTNAKNKINTKEVSKDKTINLEKIITKNKEWYEKFRWFFTINNHLVLGGKDAKNNELLVKKYMQKDDLYFHADIHGAPHVILKKEGDVIDEKEMLEVAIFSACFSSAWKSKYYNIDVYNVNAEQVSKTPNSGESLSTGAFVIRGKKNYYRKLNLQLAIGYDYNLKKLMCGPVMSIRSKTKHFFEIEPGDVSKSTMAKELKSNFLEKKIVVSVDDIISILPAGNSKIKKILK